MNWYRSVSNLSGWVLVGLMSIAALGSAGNLAADEFGVQTVNGETIVGQWAGVTGSSIQIRSGDEVRVIEMDQAVSMAPINDADPPEPPRMQATLVNGSVIAIQDMSLDGSTVRIEPRRQDALPIPIKQIRSIRFRKGSPASDPQWIGLTEKETRRDLMVIRRSNDQLDPVEGVVVGLDANTMRFELDGDPIDAPLEKLEGVIFQTNATGSDAILVKVEDIYGSVFFADRLIDSEEENVLKFTLPGPVRHTVPMDHIRKLSWSSGRILLASQSPAESKMRLPIRLNLNSDLVKDWFAPAAEGDDLVASAGGRAEYRIESGFQTLVGSVRREGDAIDSGNVEVKISLDEDVVWRQIISGPESKGFEISVGDAKRVRLEVLPTSDGEVGDVIRFMKPRLLK